jgi:putative intracellular protease/amidase
MKEVLLVLTDRWADWEASYAIAEINASPDYAVRTAAIDKLPKLSIGGIRAGIDVVIDADLSLENVAMLILPGGFSWRDNQYDAIAALVERAAKAGIPVAAICGGAVYLGKRGFLNAVKHNGDKLESFQRHPSYRGRDHFVAAQVVSDGGFITANETGALEFAREIFQTLRIDDPEEIGKWYDVYKYGMFR